MPVLHIFRPCARGRVSIFEVIVPGLRIEIVFCDLSALDVWRCYFAQLCHPVFEAHESFNPMRSSSVMSYINGQGITLKLSGLPS
jgi:hypothetical protein